MNLEQPFPDFGNVQSEIPTTGQTVNINLNTTTVILQPAGTLATLTVNLPSVGIKNNTLVRILSTQIITTLTLANGTFVGAVTTLAANAYVTYIYSFFDNKWYRCG